MIKFFKEEVTGVRFNGSLVHRYPGNLNVTFENVKKDLLMDKLSSLAISTGSACNIDKENSISHVLRGIGLKADNSETHVRFGLGRFTTEEEIDYILNLIKVKVEEIR